jgi:hypothetical protein
MEIMRVIGVLAMVAVLFPQAATADVKRHTSIPESLWGSWAPSAESCNNDKSIIALAAKRYVSSEANCTVDWVSETPGAQGAIYSAHLQCAQRARKTISDIVLRPTDSNQLSMGADFSSLKTFQRCPARGPDTIR